MDAKLIITKWDLEELPMSWFGFNGEQNKIEKKLKEVTGNRWDNNRLMFECYGLFAFSIHRRKSYTKDSPLVMSMPDGVKFYGEHTKPWGYDTNIFEWHLWDSTGLHSLGGGHFLSEPDQPMSKKMIKRLIQLCQDFNRDICTCSDCGKKINKSEIAGAYFAGRYCSHCWETKWKAIEARETYN